MLIGPDRRRDDHTNCTHETNQATTREIRLPVVNNTAEQVSQCSSPCNDTDIIQLFRQNWVLDEGAIFSDDGNSHFR